MLCRWCPISDLWGGGGGIQKSLEKGSFEHPGSECRTDDMMQNFVLRARHVMSVLPCVMCACHHVQHPRGGRLLAFRRDSPPSRSGPKAPRGGRGGGALEGGGEGGVQVGRFGVVGWGAGGGHHCSQFWTPTLTLTRASGES